MLGKVETVAPETASPLGKFIIGRVNYKSRLVAVGKNQQIPKNILLSDYLELSIDVLADMYFDSMFSENEIEYIDTFHILKDHNDISVTKDSIHPTIYGHGIIAQSILDYILN